jgi:bleomycin hydrolase
MGSQTSKTEPFPNDLISERLRALQKNQPAPEDDEYICVGNDEKQRQKYISKSPSLSISTVEKWEHELLQDPKNRSVSSPALESLGPSRVGIQGNRGVAKANDFEIGSHSQL